MTPTAWYLMSYLISPSSSAFNYDEGIITLLRPSKEVLERNKGEIMNAKHSALCLAYAKCLQNQLPLLLA